MSYFGSKKEVNQFHTNLLLWIFWKTLTAICQKRLGIFQKVPKNFLIKHFDSSLLGYPMIGLLNYKTESNPKNIWMPTDSEFVKNAKWWENTYPPKIRFVFHKF